MAGLFFAIGHEPASNFLAGQLETDADGYIVTQPGATQTSREAVFACGDVQDKKWRQAITAAGSGMLLALCCCMRSAGRPAKLSCASCTMARLANESLPVSRMQLGQAAALAKVLLRHCLSKMAHPLRGPAGWAYC